MNEKPTTGNPIISPVNKAKTPKSVKAPRRRRGRGIANFLLFIGIIAAVALFGWAEMQRRDAIGRLQETEQELEKIRESTQRSGNDVAQEILSKVSQLIDLPTDPVPTVATIVDVEALRESSPFYNKAENGDHLVITETRAILFDADRNIILDVVPVSINQEEQQQIPAGEAQATSPTEQPPQEQPAEQPEQTEQPAEQPQTETQQ